MPERLWPFPAQTPVTEVLEWSTDVLFTEAAEQRIALRTAPRSTLTVSHLLDAPGLAEAAELGRAGPLDDWALPLWQLARPATAPVDAADLTVFVDTTDGAFDGAAQAVVAADGGRAHLIEITAVLPDRLELAVPAGVSLLHAIVAPVGGAFAARPVEIDRRRQGLGTVTASFTLRSSDGGATASPYPQHQGLDVLTDPAVLRQPLAETLGQTVEAVDNGFGPMVLEPVLTHVQRRSTITLIDRGAARMTRRRWLLSLRGRQRAFWLPSWGRELVLQAAATASATSIVVEPLADPTVWTLRHLMIEHPTGPVFREITAAAWDALGLRLSIAAPGKSIAHGTPIHLLLKVRSDADRIELAHGPNRTELALPLIETPS
ncbi:hypothetical protein [Alterinioella nitratireducens]|uniref:hypothetical protein n=1 Tax=Alterinioella nitratireducens TaxID=2735915 RepID=UPI001555B79E|nr:hypothetical protein [Alterinioella nitratireducens]NPD21516.1 hypothetical protein [Alterinioella nitratireducens]